MPAGRNPKFDEPSSAVTVTLPFRTLRQLEKVDRDRSKAIVKCVEGVASTSLRDEKQVEIVKISKNAGLIVISRCHCLESIPWLRLIEIAPNRFLISLSIGTSVSSLELAIMDLMEHQAADNYEMGLLEELRRCISQHRRKEEVTKGEILFIELK